MTDRVRDERFSRVCVCVTENITAGKSISCKCCSLKQYALNAPCPQEKSNNSDTRLTVKNIMALSWLASEQMIIAANTFLPAPIILQKSEQMQVLSHMPPHLTVEGHSFHIKVYREKEL